MASGTIAIRPSGNAPQLGVKYSTSYNGSGSYTVSLWLAKSTEYSSGAYFGYRIDATVNGSTQRLKENSPSTWSEGGGKGTKTWYNVPYGSTVSFSSQAAMLSNVSIGYDGYPAPSPGSVYAKSITRTSAVLYASGYDTHGLGITNGGWDVSTNGGSSWTYYSGSPVGDKSLTGLTANTTYHFRNYVVTAGGGANSGWGSFTTSGNAPTATSLSITNVSRTSALISINGTYDTNASWGGWEWKYGLSTSSYGSVNTGTGSLTGLSPNTTYYATARFKDNWGRWSGWVSNSFKTTGNNPSITSHGVQTYGQTTMTMKYSASYDTNDSLSSYKWDVGTSTSYGKTFNNTNSLTGLTANTTYYYRLTVTSSQGRSSTATGSFKTDYATQQVTSIIAEDITETSISGVVNVPNPTWLTNLTIWIYSGDTLINTITKTSGISTSNSFLFEDLSPGTSYEIRARITTQTQNSSGAYNSNIKTLAVTTVDASHVHVIKSDGTDKKYKMYVMGKGNIYNPNVLTWQNGYYANGAVTNNISTLLTQSTSSTGGAACVTNGIEIIPNTTYTIKNLESDVSFIVHGTDTNGLVTTTGYTISPNTSYNYTGTSGTKKLWISMISNSSPLVNYAIAKYFKLNIFRSIAKTLIPKDNIVYINGKIRYIDIIQAGNTINNGSHIVALKVYDSSGNDIALNKTVTMIKGKEPLNLSRITDGDITSSDYATIEGKTSNDLETIVRVDLGQDYSNIDRVVLWRYYADDRTYLKTGIYGRDAQKRLTWKFHSYKIQGEYPETSAGYTSYIEHEQVEALPIIFSVTLVPDNNQSTLIGTNIIIDADWAISIPPVLDSYISYRTDAILAANQGRLLKNEIGDLSNLVTIAKGDLVEAINETWTDYNASQSYSNILNALLNAPLTK